MTFEEAVWIGLGLHIDSEGTVLTPKRKTCPHCLGAGELEIAPERCPKLAYMRCLSCNGRGVLEEPIVRTEAERADFEQTMKARGILREDGA